MPSSQTFPGNLITRQVPIGRWADAYTRQRDDIKTVLTFPAGAP